MKQQVVLFVFFICLTLCLPIQTINGNGSFREKKNPLPVQISQTSYNTLYQKGKVLFEQGKTEEALKIALEALELAKKTNNTSWMSQSYFLIGQIFNSSNNHTKSLSYFKNALSIIRKSNVNDGTFNIYWKIGVSYLKLEKLDSAQYYFNKIIASTLSSVKMDSLKAVTYGNLSGIYFKKTPPDLKKAEDMALLAINYHKKNNNPFFVAVAKGNLANNFYVQKKYSEAKKYYVQALNLLEDNKTLKGLRAKEAIYENLGWTLHYLKESEKSFNYINKSVFLRDSLQRASHRKELLEIEVKHRADIAKKEAIATKQKAQWLSSFLLVVTFLLLIALVFVYKNGKLKQKNKLKELENTIQNNVINYTLDKKEAQEKKITETLHDSVIQLLSSANLYLGVLKNSSSSKELEATTEILSKASKSIYGISNELISVTLLSFGLPKAIEGLCEEHTTDELNIHSHFKNIGRYEKKFEIMVYNIVDELLKNIVTHSKATNAMIRLKEDKNILIVTSLDDGKGFNSKTVKNQHGIGLAQIEARIKKMKGVFNITSSSDSGTKIAVEIPIQTQNNVPKQA